MNTQQWDGWRDFAIGANLHHPITRPFIRERISMYQNIGSVFARIRSDGTTTKAEGRKSQEAPFLCEIEGLYISLSVEYLYIILHGISKYGNSGGIRWE